MTRQAVTPADLLGRIEVLRTDGWCCRRQRAAKRDRFR
jgi:hypothetical protein